MQAAKESAANVAASARSGMEKSKATVQEKAEQMKTRDPLMKDMATQKKEAKIQAAEREKQGAIQQNRLARHEGDAGGYGHGFTAIGDTATGTGGHHHHPGTAVGHTVGGAIPGGAVGAEYPAGAHASGEGHVGAGHLSGTGHTGHAL